MKRTTTAILIAALLCLVAITAGCTTTTTYSVTFMNGTQVVGSVKVIEGESVYAPEVKLDNSKVVGWFENADFSGNAFDFSTKITKNLTLYVKTEEIAREKSYTVTFMDGKKQIASVTVKEGETVYAPQLVTSEDVTVEGWFTTADFSGKAFDFSSKITSDTVLYVKAVTNSYSVTYDLGGAEGEVPVQEAVNLDGSFTVKEPVLREGYKFLGWTDGNALYQAGDEYEVTDKNDVVLTATWEYVVLTVNFYGDKGLIETRNIPYGGDVIAPENTEHSAPWAYKFTGWDKATELKEVKEDLEVNALYEYTPTSGDYFIFTQSANGESYSVSYNHEKEETPENLVIPKEYNGKPVVAVDEEGFNYIECTRIYVPGSIKTVKSIGFWQLHSLTEIVFEEGVERLETFAVASCYILPSVTLPASLDYMGFNVFYRCYSLNEIKIAEGNETFKYENGFVKSLDGTKLYKAIYSVLGSNVTIGKEVTWMAPGLFCDDNILKQVTIDADLTYIGCGTFYNSGLETLVINGTIEEIHGYNEPYTKYPELTEREQENMMPYGAFESARYLQSVTFNSGLKFIGGGAFTNCGAKEIVLPDTVEEIAIDAFAYMYSIEKIVVSGIDSFARYYSDSDAALLERNAEEGDTLIIFAPKSPITEYEIPDTVSTVNYFAFQNNNYIKKLVIPEGVFDLKPGAFVYMMSLESLSVPSTVTALRSGFPPFRAHDDDSIPVWGRTQIYGDGFGVFSACRALSEILYPNGNNITVIGKYCFADAPLKTFTISAKLTEFYSSAVSSSVLEAWYVEDGCVLDLTAEDGVLYNKNQTQLISYPAAKDGESFVMPSSVTSVKTSAFSRVKFLKNLTVSDECTDIPVSFLVGSSSIENIVLPAKLATISPESILECPNLKTVEFRNTTASSFTNAYEFALFAYFSEDPETGYFGYKIAEDLVIKVPVESYTEYYEAFYNATGSTDYSERISKEGQTLVSYIFDSKGGTDVETVKTVVLTQLVKPEWAGEGKKFFYGWYLTDGTVAGNEWGNPVELPFSYKNGTSVTLYARWEDTRLQDGKSWDTCIDLSENNVFTIESASVTKLYFCFTATETGKLVNGAGDLPFHSEVLEAFAMQENYRVWAMLWTQPEENYDYLISMSSRYVTAGETYYMTLEFYRYDGEPIDVPVTIEITFEIDTTKVKPTENVNETIPAMLPSRDKREYLAR